MTEYVAICKDEDGFCVIIRAYETSLAHFNHEIRVNGYKISFSCTFKNYPKVASRYYSKKEHGYYPPEQFCLADVRHYSNYWIVSRHHTGYPVFD